VEAWARADRRGEGGAGEGSVGRGGAGEGGGDGGADDDSGGESQVEGDGVGQAQGQAVHPEQDAAAGRLLHNVHCQALDSARERGEPASALHEGLRGADERTLRSMRCIACCVRTADAVWITFCVPVRPEVRWLHAIRSGLRPCCPRES